MFISPGSRAKAGGKSFPSGTTMLFWQASAPLGWTKITTQNDALLRVVSGVGGPLGGGGTNAFSTVNAQTVVGATSLSTAQLASHNHGVSDPGHTHLNQTSAGYTAGGGPYGVPANQAGATGASATGISIQSNGSGSSHNHTVSFSILYVDVILASKN